jgi:hypothetical protein
LLFTVTALSSLPLPLMLPLFSSSLTFALLLALAFVVA